jgi:hypothetical protein
MATENPTGLGLRERQIVALLLQGCSNTEIAKQLKMKPRTVKAYFNRLFERFGIDDGIKRVKLATLLYRRSIEAEQLLSNNPTENTPPVTKSAPSADLLDTLTETELVRAAVATAGMDSHATNVPHKLS